MRWSFEVLAALDLLFSVGVLARLGREVLPKCIRYPLAIHGFHFLDQNDDK